MKVTDPVLQRVVPAELVSYRQLTEAYPSTAPAEAASFACRSSTTT